MRLYMAGVLKPAVGSAQLTAMGCFPDRLVNFYVCKTYSVDPDAEFEYFVKNGDAVPYKKRKNFKSNWVKNPVYKRERILALSHRLDGRLGDEKAQAEIDLHEWTAPPQRVNCLLDSGSYTAWRRDNIIHMDEYIGFIKRNQHLIEHYVNLDKIPGRWGRTRTVAEVEASAKESYESLQFMKGQGLSPMPVFHRGEPFRWLKQLLDDGEQYIGVAPRSSDTESMAWLDKVFTLLTDSDGIPIIKVHGMGITATTVMFAYPWESVDSTTWSTVTSNGGILIPRTVGGRIRHDIPPMLVHCSNTPIGVKPLHTLGSLAPREYQYVMDYIEETEVSSYQLRYDYLARIKCTGLFYKRAMEQLHARNDSRFKRRLKHPTWMGS